MASILQAVLLLQLGVVGSAKPEAHPNSALPEGSHSAFVFLFEWSWSDIAKECEEFLGPKGYKAVQISPPNEHITGPAWWTRYQPVTYNLTSRSGNEQEFTTMIQTCNQAGVGIYADAVFNHIAGGEGKGVAGSYHGDRQTAIYSPDEMHHSNDNSGENCVINNYADAHNVQYCDLGGLPDLCTGCESVQNKVADYITKMANLGIEGFRIDAAKHQDVGELTQLLGRVPSNLFRFSEVISGAGEAVKPKMYEGLGDVTEFRYFRELQENFISDGKMQYFDSFGEPWGFLPSKDAIVFIDNHDTQRGESRLTYKNGLMYQLASVFMLAHPYGYPRVMSSFAFQDRDTNVPTQPVHSAGRVNCGDDPTGEGYGTSQPWVCEHRWTAISNMVGWRQSAGDSKLTKWQAPGGDTIAFCRGDSACIALNRQDGNNWEGKVTFSLPAGRYCNVIQSDDTDHCEAVEVGDDGSVNIQVPPMSAVALHIGKAIPNHHKKSVNETAAIIV